MYKKTPIICPHCKKDTGYTQEGLMFCVVTEDLKCPYCQKVVVPANKTLFDS